MTPSDTRASIQSTRQRPAWVRRNARRTTAAQFDQPSGRYSDLHRTGILGAGGAGRVEVSGRQLSAQYQLGHSTQRDVAARGNGIHSGAAYLGRACADSRRFPLFRASPVADAQPDSQRTEPYIRACGNLAGGHGTVDAPHRGIAGPVGAIGLDCDRRRFRKRTRSNMSN